MQHLSKNVVVFVLAAVFPVFAFATDNSPVSMGNESQSSLDAVGVIQTIQYRVSRRFFMSSEQYHCDVRVKVDSSGEVTDVIYNQCSGADVQDAAAKAIYKAAPYPELVRMKVGEFVLRFVPD